jgi:methionyl-tRNA formyltransferase
VSTPRIVLLTGGGIEHRYVASRLCAALPVHAVVVDEHVRSRSLRRAFRGGVRHGLGRIGLIAFRRAIRDERQRDAALRRVLGDPPIPGDVRTVVVDGINSPQAVAAVGAAEPDLLLVFGTALVGPEMLALARRLALNLHTGISPQYRGTDCAFWPVVNHEPEWLGATVHECTAAVDGGRIFAVVRARPQPGDGIHELFARAVEAGATAYVETVTTLLEHELAGEPQDLTAGREYRGYMRTLAPELRARWALRRGLVRQTG